SNAVKDAVRRKAKNALTHYVVAMLWQLSGYSIDQAAGFLRSTGRLSAAGEALGRLLRSEEAGREHINLATEFWERAIENGAAENLTGFGWFSEIRDIDDAAWTALTLQTLIITHGRIDWAHRVA